jgi:hypothetical protein
MILLAILFGETFYSKTLQTNKAASIHMSKLLLAFCKKHDVFPEEFILLTLKENLPTIDSSVALGLIQL